jgi:hypothetical protein
MNRFILAFGLVFFSINMGQAANSYKSPRTIEMQMRYNQYGMPTYGTCHRMLRRAGYLAHGKGSRNKNFMATDACMRNYGYI